MPLTGTWFGGAEASLGMSVEVIVRRADEMGTGATSQEFDLDDRAGPFLRGRCCVNSGDGGY